MDRFKHINDSLGHVIGDRLLQSIAQRLLGCVRASDTVSRQGGDEFVILLSEVTHAQDATICADKILEALRTPHRIDEHDVHVTASIGIVTYPDDGTDCETLMKHADFAMYHAKENGRDNRQFFKRDLNLRAVKRHSLEDGVRHALEREEFSVHYQPKVNLEDRRNRRSRGAHPMAPSRPWTRTPGIHSDRRRVRTHGADRSVGVRARPVIRHKLGRTSASRRFASGSTSPRWNCAQGFLATVGAILAETGLDPRFLELELTETFLMQDSTATSAVLHALKRLGLKLALDDFGTGYSSLNHLKRFPIDTLKIDRSFVRTITTNSDDASIVCAVISMGKNLHMRVVAEGIETREQLAFLQDRECPFGQGYYFSQPLTGQACTQLLRRGIAVDDRECQPC